MSPCSKRDLDLAGRAGPLPYALAMARRGWKVFPLLPAARDSGGSLVPPGKTDQAKRPDGALVPNGCRGASCDELVLRRWFDGRGDAGLGLGLVTGPSGLVVLDIDPRNGGDKSIAALADGREWPRTPAAITGGGGWHFLYRQPTDLAGDPVPLRGKLAPGVDVRAGWTYICVAPTLHQSGERYRWAPEARPSETPLADLPGWALDLLVRSEPEPQLPAPRAEPQAPARGPSPEERASRYLARMEPSVSGSGGHARLWAAALALVGGFELEAGTALAMLAGEFNPRCQPPWSPRELRHKVEQAGAASSGRGWLLNKGRTRP